jgi:hypothetical protein
MDATKSHPVRLGVVVDGGLAPAILAVVERGVHHRPALAKTLDAEIELDMEESATPVRIVFGREHILVEDGPAAAPDLRIAGAMSDLTSLMAAPVIGGVPHPMRPRGRTALGILAARRVRVKGRLSLMRRFLNLIRI